MIPRTAQSRADRPHVRPALLACVLAVFAPACGPEGEGSVHIERSRASSVMVTPDRKVPLPPETKARRGRATTKSNMYIK